MAVYGDGDCLDGPEGCGGETFPRLALSGSGDAYSRCDAHYEVRGAAAAGDGRHLSPLPRDGAERFRSELYRRVLG